MGRHYKFIPAKTIDLILELRQKGMSYMNIAEEVQVNPQRVTVICCQAGLDEKRKYKITSSGKKKPKFEGMLINGYVTKPRTRERLKEMFYSRNIIGKFILDDKVTNTFTRTYTKPLLK